MKNKLSFISIFTLCIALSLTACGGKQSSNTDSKNTQTEAGSETSGKSDSKLDDLYQQETQRTFLSTTKTPRLTLLILRDTVTSEVKWNVC